jgi:hypothetical protein
LNIFSLFAFKIKKNSYEEVSCTKLHVDIEIDAVTIADLLKNGRVENSLYLVKSQSGHGKYKVSFTGKDWSCSCPDHEFRG